MDEIRYEEKECTTMKTVRQVAILDIIEKNDIETQEELAEACELSSGYVSQLEAPNCFFCPSLKTLFKIAEALGTTVSKLTDIED